MEKAHIPIAMLGIVLLNAVTGGCVPSHTKVFSNGNKFYGVEATLDVYGFSLGNDQVSQASIWIVDRGDGQPSSVSGIQAGWNISPIDYKDSNTHFYVAGPDKDCLNMECHGFRKTSSSITPGDVINPVSNINGKKQHITLRLFKAYEYWLTCDKSTGDWHVHYGFNGPPQPVGYLPKSLLPKLINKPVEISFGGLVSHRKPQRSPPLGGGRLPATTLAASFSDLKVIDEHGNKFVVNINLPARVSPIACYFLSTIDPKKSRFFYGGAGCDD
ncbi:hypothetical protein BS78_09G023700 [Paspalum vaginatum]|nr:hypothetical protein BS78_09G023700 [Paspalum vaginatum]